MKIKLARLRRFNLIMAGLHAAQGLLILFLSRDVSFPINLSFLTFNTTTRSLEPASQLLFNVNLAWLVAAFLFISALAHLIIATIYRRRYEAGLSRGINRARWIEYAISASTMMVAIAILVGIYDLASLVMIFALVAVMNLLGLAMEVVNQFTKKTSWITFVIGSLAGIVPWVAIALYFWGSSNSSAVGVPTFVYWIYVSIFLFFNCFAINMWLQYRKMGRWADYLYGERAYIILSLVAKSALAWQVFAGTLRP